MKTGKVIAEYGSVAGLVLVGGAACSGDWGAVVVLSVGAALLGVAYDGYVREEGIERFIATLPVKRVVKTPSSFRAKESE